jgi:transposase
MPAATSTDLRERIIHWFYDLKLPVEEIVLLSGRSRSTIFAILRLYDRYGEVTNPHANRTGRQRILDPNDLQYIQSILEARPTSYLDEIQEKLFQNREILVSLATLSRTLRRLFLSNKRVSKEALERDELLRATWLADNGIAKPEELVFLDEAGVDDHTGGRTRGWSAVGSPCVMRAAFFRGQKYSILPALDCNGVMALDIFEGAINKERFISFLRNQVVRFVVNLCSTLTFISRHQSLTHTAHSLTSSLEARL